MFYILHPIIRTALKVRFNLGNSDIILNILILKPYSIQPLFISTLLYIYAYFSTVFIYISFSSVQSLSCVWLCCDPMNCSTPGLPVHRQLPEFTQTGVHRVSDASQPSHPLSSPSPPDPNPFQHQGLFQWVNSSHEVARVLEFQLQHQSFQWTPRTNLLWRQGSRPSPWKRNAKKQNGCLGKPYK